MTPEERREERLAQVSKQKPKILRSNIKTKKPKFIFKRINRFEKALGKINFSLPKSKTLSSEQIASKFNARRNRTYEKIIASRGASPLAKARARRMLRY